MQGLPSHRLAKGAYFFLSSVDAWVIQTKNPAIWQGRVEYVHSLILLGQVPEQEPAPVKEPAAWALWW